MRLLPLLFLWCWLVSANNDDAVQEDKDQRLYASGVVVNQTTLRIHFGSNGLGILPSDKAVLLIDGAVIEEKRGVEFESIHPVQGYFFVPLSQADRQQLSVEAAGVRFGGTVHQIVVALVDKTNDPIGFTNFSFEYHNPLPPPSEQLKAYASRRSPRRKRTGSEGPYLSVVYATHNDPAYGHPVLNLDRLQHNLNMVAAMTSREDVNFKALELIIVDWNPPRRTLPLREALQIPESLSIVRIITVPAEVHKRFPNPDRMPIHEYLARNVGLRQARGEFVLLTSGDSIPNLEFWKWMATRPLKRDKYYRMERQDISRPVPAKLDPMQWLVFAEAHSPPHQIGTGVPTNFEGEKTARPWIPFCEAAGDFILAPRSALEDAGGFWENSYYRTHVDCLLVSKLEGLKHVHLKAPFSLYHQFHSRGPGVEEVEDHVGGLAPLEEFDENRVALTRLGLRYNPWDWGFVKDRFHQVVLRHGAVDEVILPAFSRDWGECEWNQEDEVQDPPEHLAFIPGGPVDCFDSE